MAFLKDIYDIVLKDTKADQKLKDFVSGLFTSSKKITDEEKILQHKELVKKFTEKDFAKNFTNLLDYFGVLLALIVETTYIKHKGCIIRNFYSSKYHFYFPAAEEESQLESAKLVGSGEIARGIKLKNKDYYEFYAFDNTLSNTSIETLKQLIEDTVRIGQEVEVEAFINELQGKNIDYRRVFGIAQVEGKGQLYKFASPMSFGDRELQLSFLKPEEIKKSILEDLNELLDFELV